MSKTIITKAEKIQLMPEFDGARKIVTSIREHGRRMQHDFILLGVELNKTKAALGIKRGGDQKSGKSKPQNAGLIWEDLVLEQTGYSVDQCSRWMKIASGAQKHIPLLTSKDILQKPFSELPEKRQEEVVKVLQKAVDGQTMAEIAVTFGVCKAPKKAPPPGGKSTKNHFKGGATNRSKEIDPEAMRKLALTNGKTTRDIIDGKAWEHLTDDELSAWHALLERGTLAAAALLKTRADADARAHGRKKP